MRSKKSFRDQPTPFKRYCEYQLFQSQNNSKDFHHIIKDVETEIIMFPPSSNYRSKTALPTNRLSFKNIGENFENIPRLGQRNVYSRQNIQIANKKIKQLKQNMFGSCRLEDKSPEANKSPQIRLEGSAKNFTNFSLASSNKRNINSCAQIRSQKSYEPPDRFNQTIKPSTGSMSKSTRMLKNPEQKRLTVKTHNFKSTLKQKHVDDNPKILANIIRKKVQCMNKDQIHQYIQTLMRK